MTDVLRERLAAYRSDADDADWDDVLRRSRPHRVRRTALPTAVLVALGTLLAAPALGLDDRLLSARDSEQKPVPMWLGLRPNGSFCIALANRCEDVDRSRRLILTIVEGDGRFLRGYANAPEGARLELVAADGSRRPVPLRWVEAPGDVYVFSEALAPSVDPAELVLRAADGRVLAREAVRPR
jgi:hypothetical protein